MIGAMLDNFTSQKPFRPFRLVMSSGERYEVLHSEAFMRVKNGLIVQFPIRKPGELSDRFTLRSIIHINNIEWLQPREENSPTGNGHPTPGSGNS